MKLCLPEKILDQHLMTLGKTGSGKSSALRHMVEHLLDKKKRVCIIDPKGDWWGLKKSADGKSPGYEDVICFGDFKEQKASDVPVNAHSGKQVAELIASGNRPCVIGFRGWMPSALARFWIDFSSTLFNSNSNSGLTLVISEIQNFAPKERLAGGDENLALHWTKRLMLEGRGIGIVMLMDSQRPQSVHNTILTQCETLVAMRVIHESDRAATETWIKGAGDKVKGAEVLNTLASMARGEAWVWSPEIDFGPQRVKFPMFETFDSFAPPQLQKKISNEGWSTVNLDDVKSKLAKVIEEVEANDPAILKGKIRTMSAKIHALEAAKSGAAYVKASEKIKLVEVEVPALTGKQFKEVAWLCTKLAEFCDAVKFCDEYVGKAHTIQVELKKLLAQPQTGAVEKRVGITVSRAPVIHRPVPTMSRAHSTESGNLNSESPTGGLRRMLIALAQRPGLSARQLGVRAGLSSSSGSFNTYLSKGRSCGWLVGDRNRMMATPAGVEAIGNYDPLPEGVELLAHWLRELGQGGAGRILKALADIYPNYMTKEELGVATELSDKSGSFNTYLSKLRTLELITGSNPIQASEEFFQ